MAVVIVLIAGQMVLGREHLGLPGVNERCAVASGKVKEATEKVRGVSRFPVVGSTGDYPR